MFHSLKKQNVLTAFIGLLNVKYTHSYADKLYYEHPYKYSLFGLSKMLSEYQIENAGLRISNKEEGLNTLETPFIAHTGDEFVTVYHKDEHRISYIWQDKQINIAIDKFIEIWSGIVLIAEPDQQSVEPDYRQNQRKEWLNKVQISLLTLLVSGMFLFAYITKGLITNLGVSLSVIINLVGVYISLLLILKQMHVQSHYADKLCSLFKKSDCNNILESKDAKLWGIIGWSEMGLSYFVSNLLIVLWFPQFVLPGFDRVLHVRVQRLGHLVSEGKGGAVVSALSDCSTPFLAFVFCESDFRIYPIAFICTGTIICCCLSLSDSYSVHQSYLS